MENKGKLYQLDIFGNKIRQLPSGFKNNGNNIDFNDYDGFVKKFEPKLTTDDCYTPENVYQCVLEYVGCFVDLSKLEVKRPFYPGGNYQDDAQNYNENTIVIDNPPFSILAEIRRFYNDRKIKYFLFSPHLTLFSGKIKDTKIVCGASVEYENKAKIATSFVSNLFHGIAIKTASSLKSAIEFEQNKNKPKKLKYQYPAEVLTVSSLMKIINAGIDMEFRENEVFLVDYLQEQKQYKKTIFGKGYLISEKLSAEKLSAENKIGDDVFVWNLSEKEKQIIKNLK